MYKEKFKIPLVAALVLLGGSIGTPALAEEAAELYYTFNSDGTLYEASSASKSRSVYWWLQSGDKLEISNGVGMTLKGNENFRLLTAGNWGSATEQIKFKVTADNLSSSGDRNPWNGFSLAQRYIDDSNYYYASVRMDGLVTIKKKQDGKYSTLAQKKYFGGTWNAKSSPNLIPKNKWIDMEFVAHTQNDGTVLLEASVDGKRILTVTDNGKVGGAAITKAGRGGVYSDFMDVSMDNFVMTPQSGGSSESEEETTPEPEEEQAVQEPEPTPEPEPEPTPEPAPAPAPETNTYGLTGTSVVNEAGSMGNSSSPSWWVNSGAYLYVSNGVGKTVTGNLPSSDKWRTTYASSNPTDTDNGYHPQNIFRLLTTSKWQNLAQEAYFKINAYNESASPNRAGHNAILFFNRYEDGNNLYYTGIRVDGSVVVKKKISGKYFTMASKKIYTGTYNRSSNPILLPLKQNIGLKSVVTNNSDGSVTIKVYVDKNGSGTWTLAVETRDDGKSFGGRALTKESYAGIRTDFMDVEFKGYSIGETR